MSIQVSCQRKSHRRQVIEYLLVPIAVLTSWIIFVVEFFKFAPNFFTNTTPSSFQNKAFHCALDGQVYYISEEPAWTGFWDTSYFLTITLGFGNMTFAEAKIIDLIWDLAIGRGGQVLLALWVYWIIRTNILASMEHVSISLPVLARVAFRQLSLETLCSITKLGLDADDHGPKTGWLTRFARGTFFRASAMVLLVAYTLFFPTFISATTGYQARAEPYLQLGQNDGLIPTQALTPAVWGISDGSRIGLSDNYAVVDNSSTLAQVLSSCRSAFSWTSRFISGVTYQTFNASNSPNEAYQVFYNESRIPSHSVVTDGCDAFWYTPSDEFPSFSSNITVNNKTWSLGSQTLGLEDGTEDDLYSYQNKTYFVQDIVANGFCRAESRYVWGFSGQVLFVFSVTTAIFLAIIVLLQLDSYWHGRSVQTKQKFYLYRDVLDIAKGMKAQLGNNIDELSAEDLEVKIKANPGIFRLDVDNLPESRADQHRVRWRGSYGRMATVEDPGQCSRAPDD